ncbi:hypothetical protein CVO_01960 [Sulfurimonas sp. CVO]|jgi:hypothetical protein|uniref:Uncharacterized protein n=1 Tax=Sulfurimonas xiamenensis TaxID=2590021 RepID=A0AAJ4A4U8_9BACT|nr:MULTISPECIES: hypothetical protein [Sulfurimonas]QFR43783.1 hypothetical protein FJR47_07610 [Sulfurimonas xiamenensis]QHG90679.1 hypothetical protein CVO_01960 [Sulfurimonas sp. CVO]
MKTVVSILFLIITVFASENKHIIKTQILEKIFTNISIQDELIIWSDNKNLLFEFKESTSLKTSSTCEDSSLIILDKKQNLKKSCYKKTIFVLDYSLLKEIPRSFGAMFWKKGRPNIVILKPRIKEQSIKVSNKLDKYIEEKIW